MDAAIIKLVDQAKEGNNTAFTKLYNKYKQNIWYTILNIVKIPILQMIYYLLYLLKLMLSCNRI